VVVQGFDQVGSPSSLLIIIRGPSGAGKSSVADAVRRGHGRGLSVVQLSDRRRIPSCADQCFHVAYMCGRSTLQSRHRLLRIELTSWARLRWLGHYGPFMSPSGLTYGSSSGGGSCANSVPTRSTPPPNVAFSNWAPLINFARLNLTYSAKPGARRILRDNRPMGPRGLEPLAYRASPLPAPPKRCETTSG
jgi:hypothetical protein